MSLSVGSGQFTWLFSKGRAWLRSMLFPLWLLLPRQPAFVLHLPAICAAPISTEERQTTDRHWSPCSLLTPSALPAQPPPLALQLLGFLPLIQPLLSPHPNPLPLPRVRLLSGGHYGREGPSTHLGPSCWPRKLTELEADLEKGMWQAEAVPWGSADQGLHMTVGNAKGSEVLTYFLGVESCV